MEKWSQKPLDFGEILDVTFRITKEHFSKLFLMVLLLMGPMYLLQWLALYLGGISLLPGPVEGPWMDTFLERIATGGIDEVLMGFGTVELALFIISAILMNMVSIPLADAAVIFATDKIRKKEDFQIGTVIKHAFSRFWALFGGSTVYFLIMVLLFSGFGLIFLFYFMFVGEPEGTLPIIILVVLSITFFFGVVYLLTRWSYYFAPIVFDKVSPGLRKSWNLTRGRFWRLMGLYFVLFIITTFLSATLQGVTDLFLAGSIIGIILNSLFSMLIMMIFFIAYAVIYFDLRIRNEAEDLRSMVEAYGPSAADERIDEPMEQPMEETIDNPQGESIEVPSGDEPNGEQNKETDNR